MTPAPGSAVAMAAPAASQRHGFGRLLWVVIAVATLLGSVSAMQTAYPRGGAILLAAIRDLQENGFAPALTTSYNGTISYPFPFLGLELVAVVSSVTGLDPLTLLRVLPVVLGGLTLVAFAWLARELLDSPRHVVVATVAYAALAGNQPGALGGGVAAGLGALLVVVGLYTGARAFRGGRPRTYLLCGVVIGLAQLAHPYGGMASAIGLLALLVLEGPSRVRLLGYGATGLVALVVAAPWWMRVLAELGPGPLISAGGPDLAGLPDMLLPAPDPGQALVRVAAAAVLGLALVETVLHPSRLLGVLIGWAIAVAVLASRDPWLALPVPLALFAAAGIESSIRRTWTRSAGQRASSPSRNRRLAVGAGAVVAAVAVAIPLAVSGTATTRDGLGGPELDALRAAGDVLGPGTRTLVVTGADWAADEVSEWFPALSGAISAVTPQGTEWHGAGVFQQAVEDHDALQACAGQTMRCIDAWGASTHLPYDAIYVAGTAPLSSQLPGPTLAGLTGITPTDGRDCCAPLRDSLRADPAWTVIHDAPGGVIAVPSGRTPLAAAARPFPAPVTTASFDVPSSIDATGSSDVAAELNAFIASVPDGSTIVFRAGGTYRLDPGGIVLYDRRHLVLDGNGATLRVTNPGETWLGGPININSQRTAFGENSHILVRDFTLVGSNPNTTTVHTPGAGQNQHGIGIWGGSFIEVAGNRISATYGDGVYVSGNDDTHASADHVWIHDNTITFAGRNAIALTAATNALIERNTFDAIGLHVLDLEADWAYQVSADIVFRANRAGSYGHSTAFVGFFFASNGEPDATVRDVTVTGNTVTGNPRGGYDGSPRGLNTNVTTPGQQRIAVTDNTTTMEAAGPVLTFAGVDGVTVTGNRQPLLSGGLAAFSNCTGVVYR